MSVIRDGSMTFSKEEILAAGAGWMGYVRNYIKQSYGNIGTNIAYLETSPLGDVTVYFKYEDRPHEPPPRKFSHSMVAKRRMKRILEGAQ